MDITPQVINEVEFHQKMRGYDPDEVDDFLERVAVAVEQLQARVREAEQRVQSTPRSPAAAAAPSPTAPLSPTETDEAEAIRRTLVLAQRTADAAIKEAEEEARRTLQAAQDQVQRLYTEAQDQARKLVVDAEADARKAADDTRQRLIKEIITLEETRDAMRADHGILERHLDEQRLRLRSSIGELQRLLDDPGRLRGGTAPELSGVTRPSFVDDALAESAAVVDDGAISEAAPQPDAAVIDLDAPTTTDTDTEIDERPVTGGVTFTPPDEANGAGSETSAYDALEGARITVAGSEEEESAWTRFARGDLDGPPTEETSATDFGDDAYLTELRKAMLADTSAATVEPDAHRAKSRFGRRR